MPNYNNLSLTGNTKTRRDVRSAKTKSKFAQVIATHLTDPSLSVNQIKYRINGTSQYGYAFPVAANFSNLPLKGEFVEITKGPGRESTGTDASLDYFSPAVNIWNHPQHGATTSDGSAPELAPEFNETVDTNPLYPFAGDIILEGRRGQSIRFTQNFSNTPWTSPSASQPVVIIANGQVTTQEGSSYIVEDINNDPASIYLTSAHKLPLAVAYEWKRDGQSSYTDSAVPVSANNFTGAQVVLNSDRIYFNAKNESVLLSAKETVGLLGKEVHLDATNLIALEAPVVRLTGDSYLPNLQQAAVKGDNLVDELNNLYNYLLNVTDLLVTLASATNNPDGVRRAGELAAWLKTSTADIQERILSKKVFLS